MIVMNMFFISLFFLLLSPASPNEFDSQAQILSNEYTIDEKGNYKFSYETSNGIMREEKGSVINEGLSNQHLIVQGRSTYINEEGKKEIIEYIADENGYRVITPVIDRISTIPAALPGSVVASLLGK